MKTPEPLSQIELKYIKCIFCKKPLITEKEIVRIIEYTDQYCSEIFQFYFAHAKCLFQSIWYFQNYILKTS